MLAAAQEVVYVHKHNSMFLWQMLLRISFFFIVIIPSNLQITTIVFHPRPHHALLTKSNAINVSWKTKLLRKITIC